MQPCELGYEKGRAVLAYLAAEPGRRHARATLAAMLWPNLEREAALTNLRQVLRDLHRALDLEDDSAQPLQTDRESIRIEPGSSMVIDVGELAAVPATCPEHPAPERCNDCLARMESCVGKYRGEFMAGFSLRECADFEEWLQIQRETMHLRVLARLTRLSDCLTRTGAHARSLQFALRFLELEPWNEEALRRTMRLHSVNGQNATGLAQYEAFCRALKRELGVLPSAETHALAELLRKGDANPAAPVVRTAPAIPFQFAGRRQVTVLYCDLTSAMSEDPDAALERLRVPQALCQAVLGRHSGYLVQTHGGSLLAYFGFPQAREDAARRAVRAALELARTPVAGIDVRVGVHTGMVISGDDPQVPDAIGASSRIAIRLCQRANSGEVAISAATLRLIAGYFETRPDGHRQQADGTGETFRVVRESAARSRLDAAPELTPLVGRTTEIETLLGLWRDARDGTRQVVLLHGDAGIGKSRLVHTLKEALRRQPCLLRELHCHPEYSQSPMHPLIALFQSALAFAADEPPAAKFDKLAGYVETHYKNTDREAVPLLAEMLSLPLRAPYREPSASPQQRRARTMGIILDRLSELAAGPPVLLVVEDLHWADPSTIEFLRLFVTQGRPAPVLAVFTARNGFCPPWPESLVKTLALGALDDDETAALIAAVAPRISPVARRRIVDRADGIPLFAEELAREIGNREPSAIPSTLHDLLAARLDNTAAAKSIALRAATIGREFRFDLLKQVCDLDAPVLSMMLSQLRRDGIVYGGDDGLFRFRHALIRDVAYQAQTGPDREESHRKIAVALSGEGNATPAEILAQHWQAGGELRKAATCWILAGKQASRHSASPEATAHFKSGIALIDALPADQETAQTEIELQIGLGAAACAAEGYASAAGAAAYERALQLCRQHDCTPEMFPAVWGLWASASSRVGYRHALQLANRLLGMAARSGDPIQDQQAHFAVADTLYWQGDFVSARQHLERVRGRYQATDHLRHACEFGEDAGVTAAAYQSWVLWFLGFPEQARAASVQAVAHARQLDHPFSLAYALTFASILRCRLRQPEAALELAQENLALSTRHDFPLWQIGAALSTGWAQALMKRHEGVDAMQRCVDATRTAMGGVTLVILGPLVEACVGLARFEAALAYCDEALAIGSALGDSHLEAELHRLRGEALLGLCDADTDEAEACFRRALTIGRRQAARSLELRAATSMARLWRQRGRAVEAMNLLRANLAWFAEGFDNPDLVDARQLLDALIACRSD